MSQPAKELANQFSSYFVNKIVNIRNNLDSENVIMTDNFRGSSNGDADVTPLEVLRPTDEKNYLKSSTDHQVKPVGWTLSQHGSSRRTFHSFFHY